MRQCKFRLLRPHRRALIPDVPPVLQQANTLLAEGNYHDSAVAFEDLARRAEARQAPRAPHLYLRAAQARLLAGQVEQAVDHLKHGLSLLAAAGQWQILHRLGQRSVVELNQRGLTREAREISDYLIQTLPSIPQASFGTTPRPAFLPTQCPGCGSSVHPEEVEWLDDLTAECAYCGTTLRIEG